MLLMKISHLAGEDEQDKQHTNSVFPGVEMKSTVLLDFLGNLLPFLSLSHPLLYLCILLGPLTC